jgi:hypothetical protein
MCVVEQSDVPSCEISQAPPPLIQRCFSASRTQLKGCVIRSPFSMSDLGALVGGWQVATVKASTNLRMKKRGKVPPRLLTL